MFGKTTMRCTAAFTAVLLLCVLCNQRVHVCAELLNNVDNVDAINNLYENLLQREYAGPIVFPSHQMERKAQRSPSLRLRFGRRSDPDSIEPQQLQQQLQFDEQQQPLVSMEKRWWGDVNQKPIRSPSLRLRFGKRQPLGADANGRRNNYDALLSNLAAIEESLAADYNGGDENDGGIGVGAYGYDRVVRKPQRLRWGRSVLPALAADNGIADLELQTEQQQQQHLQQQQQQLVNADKWRNLLMNLGAYEGGVMAGDAVMGDESAFDEFQREVRKPGGPLRLRWGRSTGGRVNGSGNGSGSNSNTGSTTDSGSKADGNLNGKLAQAKKSLGSSVLSAPKAAEQQQQQQQQQQQHVSNAN